MSKPISSRSIARELAIIVFPQLPRDTSKLEKMELSLIISRSVAMLCDYAKQNLQEANALVLDAGRELTEIDVEHPINEKRTEVLNPAPLNTDQLRRQLEHIELAIHFVSEALDIPELAVKTGDETSKGEVKEFISRLLGTYVENRERIDQFIKQAKSKWKVERMVSIDRDILRLACTEAFFMDDIPINVSISEAVELSNRFADKKAASFINGVLRDLSGLAGEFRETGSFPSQADQEAPVTGGNE